MQCPNAVLRLYKKLKQTTEKTAAPRRKDNRCEEQSTEEENPSVMKHTNSSVTGNANKKQRGDITLMPVRFIKMKKVGWHPYFCFKMPSSTKKQGRDKQNRY